MDATLLQTNTGTHITATQVAVMMGWEFVYILSLYAVAFRQIKLPFQP